MSNSEILRELPSVNEVLVEDRVAEAISGRGEEIVKYALRHALRAARANAVETNRAPEMSSIVSNVLALVAAICGSSLKPVINATGVVLHTNLGRAPLGDQAVAAISSIARGYSNVECDLFEGRRGHRTDHVREILKFLTGAEDVAVVNNNAAAVMLALNTLAYGREVIVSRGELIEIGGSFRIPEIMAASGARMIEVGTTNRTRLSDYEKAINSDTALFFKAHKSNYTISGFTEEVSIEDLAGLAKAKNLPMFYDIGSGLLHRPEALAIDEEPDVKSALAMGADIVAFSGDKLLGGPQAGIIAGRSEVIKQLAKAPMMRALRVDKLTLAALAAVCRQHLDNGGRGNPTFDMLSRTGDDVKAMARTLCDAFSAKGVKATVVEGEGQCGGGTLPELRISTFAVELDVSGTGSPRQTPAERLFKVLLEGDLPVMGILRAGKLLFDVLTINDKDIPVIVDAVLGGMKVET